MGGACTTTKYGSNSSLPHQYSYQPPRRPTSLIQGKSIRYSQQLQTQNSNHSNNNNQVPPNVDPLTHTIQLLSSSQFQVIPIYSRNSSPSKRPTIVPNAADHHHHLSQQQIPVKRPSSTPRLRLEKPIPICFTDLTFKQSVGQGTYGEVSRGYWKGRKVAIKKIFPGTNVKERLEVLSDFDREIAILSKLRHPRIVQFMGAVNEQDQPLCLVFELCEGSAAVLLKMIRRGAILVSWRTCLGILRDCAEAVHYLHSQTPKILHRDLKAENLLLEQDFHCKLTDFGLSRSFDARRPSAMTVCGTPCWVAPEVFRNEPYDEKIDVYSFGILIWEIFAAKKPYGDRDCNDLSNLVGSKGLRPGKLTHIPSALNELMANCWDETPSKRPDFARIRIWLDRVWGIVEDHRRLSAPVHVTHYNTACWDSTNAIVSKPDIRVGGQQQQQQLNLFADNKRFSTPNPQRRFRQPPSYQKNDIEQLAMV